ncbi:MAG: hypothetical protein GWN79_27640 [Actinobacteria bacterium]|nr:hypothetical protein [Actinomycetota bacterium]NIS36836.1 hypothetical protein [Actinomycetota bacterium]NIT98933.1 hypothetical protein [Actinomycetota bacterium]NIU22581.1 hypothetical protein [Actinomycetota bacterium]NIU71326.1 hypothetical protein [Actinomycetota bacterium]
MENVKPSSWMLMGGGLVLLISTFLDWVSVSAGGFDFGENAWDTDFFGLLGIICALIGLLVGGGVAAQTFGKVNMPDRVLGFTHDQIHLILGCEAFVITFGLVFRGDVGIGLWLGLVSAVVITAGAYMDLKADAPESAAPTQF